MAALCGVLSRDLTGYVCYAYRPGWSDSKIDQIAGMLLSQVLQNVILQSPIDYRLAFSRLMSYGFTSEQLSRRLFNPSFYSPSAQTVSSYLAAGDDAARDMTSRQVERWLSELIMDAL